MQRVGDVEGAAGERLGRGHPSRCHAKLSSRTGTRRSMAVTPASSADRLEPILPRAREHRELEHVLVGNVAEKRLDELMGVFAHAGRLRSAGRNRSGPAPVRRYHTDIGRARHGAARAPGRGTRRHGLCKSFGSVSYCGTLQSLWRRPIRLQRRWWLQPS